MVKHNIIHPYSGTPFINNKALINVTIRAAKKICKGKNVNTRHKRLYILYPEKSKSKAN